MGSLAETSWEGALGFANVTGGYGTNNGYYVMGRRMYGLFAPQFTKGLDAQGKSELLAKSERATAGTPGDAVPLLHPTPGMLMGIPLGVGLDGGAAGYIGITPGEADGKLLAYSSKNFGFLGAPPEMVLDFIDSSILPNRFDYASSLRFIGPVGDFHVVYETSREAAKRGAGLPAAIPTTQETTDTGCQFFFQNWDLPRLKQVVSRDFIVNITPQGLFKNEVEIYRRPANAGPVDRTPGKLITDLNRDDLVRTLVLENPDAESDPYPASPEYLQITESGKTYSIWRTDYPTYNDIYNFDYRILPPDLNFEIQEGETVRHAEYMAFTGISSVTTETQLDGTTVSEDTVDDENWAWFLGMEPSSRTIVRGSQIITVANTHAANPSPWYEPYRSEWYPLTSRITVTNEPVMDLVWNSNGRLVSREQGAWLTNYDMEGDALKAVSKFNGSTYSTTWIEWSNNDRTIKTYSAPDGSVSSKSDDKADFSELTLGNTSGTGLPGLPLSLSRKDGSEVAWTWAVGTDHSGSLTIDADSQSQTTAWNNRNFIISSQTSFTSDGGTVNISNHAVPTSQFTAWGAPTQWKDQTSNLASSVAYEAALSRPSSTTSPLGLVTAYSNYDVFNRPGQVISNNITATNTFEGLTTTTNYGGQDVVSGSQNSFSRNPEGTNLTTGLTWGGVVQSQNANRGATSTAITGSHTLLGSSSATLRKEDGSLSAATNATLAFGGLSGDALSVVNGLLVTKSAVTNRPGTFAETHTDAWGRVRKVVTPSKSGSGSTQTSYAYSLLASSLKRTITTEPSGRTLITESEASGTITRSGIDLDGDGQLGSADRYTESTTSVANSKVVTTLSITEDSGLREVIKSEWNPATGITQTNVNGNEEDITQTVTYPTNPPLAYPTPTLTTASNKGWSRTTVLNELGLATNNTLNGTGVPHTELKPEWRADGSLKKVDLEITTAENKKEIHTASFKPDGTLDTLIAPGRGNILTSHTISNGTETLIVNGVTMQASLDGTSKSTSGDNMIGRSEVLTASASGSGYQKRTTPAVGATTDSFYNSALAPTGKTYIDTTGEVYSYFGELLSTITLARGGQITLGYANNGAKDFTSANWPAMASGPFTIPSVGVGFTYNRSGKISTQSDPSGTRTLGYLKGRLISTAYTAGTLKGYEILPGRDEVGRQNGTLIKRDGAAIHSTTKLFNGVSDQVTDLASGNITATPQRDGAGRIIGYVWSDGSNTVNQTWTRSEGGRIDAAGSNVTGAPTFNYADGENAFDAAGRRLKCTTAGGNWTYVYGAGGQLTSATHSSLGAFSYAFDGIGRRTDKGTANTNNDLNQTTAWTNSQNKTVTIKAAPGARVWFNGVEVQNFSGTHQEDITSPGPDGGWVPWETLAVLEGQGQGAGNPAVNPFANPDAKAQKKGAVWVPPVNETLTYDAAGNRQSSALWDLGWDAKNQLTRVRTKGYTTAPQAYDITFAYDTEGRRVRKQVVEYQNGVKVAEKNITFVWDGWDLLYERQQLPSGLTTLERKYLWGPDIADGEAGGAGGLLLIRETKGNTTTNIIPLYDGTGHVVALTDINKNLLASYAYGPFGEKISATGEKANSNPWRWATKYQDEETGFYYFGHRFYDPTTGQWLSREILGESESVNLYQYCGNDPLNHVDVLGLFETQQQVDDARVTVLLGMLNRNPNQLPVEFPQELKELCYLQNADKFGMTKPFGVEDYKRAIAYVEKAQACSGAMMSRNDHPDDQPSIRSGESMPPSAAFTLTMGLGAPCVNPAIAEFNGGLLIPFGIEGYALGGVIKTAQVTRILATGASIERALLIQGVGAELRTGVMVSSEASQMLSAGTKVGTIVSNNASHLVPGGGLMAHEAEGGHLLALHLGQSESQLASRLASNSRLSAASTFGTRAEAEAAISHAFDHNASTFSNWLRNGAQGRQVLNAPWTGGTVLQRGAASAIPGTGVRAVLQGNGSGGYYILTGFPTP